MRSRLGNVKHPTPKLFLYRLLVGVDLTKQSGKMTMQVISAVAESNNERTHADIAHELNPTRKTILWVKSGQQSS